MKISTSPNVHAKFMCSNLFRGSYFRVLVVGHENRENLDLAKISRYTVLKAGDCVMVFTPVEVHSKD